MTFDNEGAFIDYWKMHPAIGRYWDDGMREPLLHELTSTENGSRVLANPEAIRVAAREITVDRSVNDAGARVEVPTHLIVVERGTADENGGMVPRAVAEQACDDNTHLDMQYIEDVNHYSLMIGKGAPLVAAALSGH